MRTAGACLLRGSYSLIFVVKIKAGHVLRNGFFSDINYLEDLFFFGRSVCWPAEINCYFCMERIWG